MKTLFIFCCLALCAPALQSFVSTGSKVDEVDKSLAKVNRVDGYYIFFQSTPVAQYEILGTVKRSGTFQMSNSPEAMYNGLIKKAKKEFPKADAIIFDGAEMEKATCVQFK